MREAKPKHASLRPADFTSGGLLDDADVTITEARFVMWDYQGQIREPVPAMAVTMETGGEGTPLTETYTQYYSCGDSKNMTPSQDGKTLEVTGSHGLKSNSNAGQFLTELVKAGFPDSKLAEGDISVLDGMEAHVIRIPQPKRAGLAKSAANPDKEQTILVVNKIHKLPWDKTAKKSQVAKMPVKAETAAAPVSTEAHTEKAKTVVMDILANLGGSAPKNKIVAEVFKALISDPDRQAVIALVYQDGFLASDSNPWKYDPKTTKVEIG
jgi:hypothetical protein